MEAKHFFTVATAILIIGAYIPYLKSICDGTTTPQRVTWIVLLILDFLTVGSITLAGGGSAVILPALYTFGSVVVVLLSMKRGVGGKTLEDKICFASAMIAIVIWIITGSAVIAVACSVAANAIASWPTKKKMYFQPQTEDRLSWTLFFAGSIASLGLIEAFTIENAAFSLFCVADGLIIMVLLYRPRSN